MAENAFFRWEANVSRGHGVVCIPVSSNQGERLAFRDADAIHIHMVLSRVVSVGSGVFPHLLLDGRALDVAFELRVAVRPEHLRQGHAPRAVARGADAAVCNEVCDVVDALAVVQTLLQDCLDFGLSVQLHNVCEVAAPRAYPSGCPLGELCDGELCIRFLDVSLNIRRHDGGKLSMENVEKVPRQLALVLKLRPVVLEESFKVDGVRQLLEQVVGVVLEELRHDLLDFVHGVQALFCLEVSLHRELLVQVVFCFGEVCVDGLD